MSVEALAALPIRHLAAPSSHLYLWTTDQHLLHARQVFEAWGFNYAGSLVSIKPHLGTGDQWRVCREFLLLGVRGNLTIPDRTQQSCLFADRGRHSAKPSVFRKLIEKVSPGPRLELFARSQAEGWTTWGDQIQPDLFDDLPDGPTEGS